MQSVDSMPQLEQANRQSDTVAPNRNCASRTHSSRLNHRMLMFSMARSYTAAVATATV